MDTLGAMLSRFSFARARLLTWWGALPGLRSDALLYGLSAVFALGLGMTSRQGAQWQWGYLATGPYALCALLAYGLYRLKLQRTTMIRVALLTLVMLGTVAIPLGLEARWRVAQPEVGVIQRAGDNLSKDRNLYPTYDKHGKLIDPIEGIPSFESF